MVHFQTLDIFSRRFTQSMIHGITVSSSMFKNFPARHMQRPLRPRPVSQLITPRQSSKLRVAVSVESLLRQSGTTANSHTLHQPYPGVLCTLIHACDRSLQLARPTKQLTLSRKALSSYTRDMSGRQQRVMIQPINVIFRHLQQQTRVSLWLYDNVEYRLEGKIIVSF